LKLTCIARSQDNPWNIFLSLAGNTFSCCHSLYFWNYFVNILYIFVKFCSVKTVCLMKWQPLRAVVLEDQSYLALWSWFSRGNLMLISGGIEKKLCNFENAQTVSSQFKMQLTSLDDFYGLWHFYICHSLFGHLTFFVTSLVFMKGTSCCVIRRNFKWNWGIRSCYGKVL